jgi:hypothetical protein
MEEIMDLDRKEFRSLCEGYNYSDLMNIFDELGVDIVKDRSKEVELIYSFNECIDILMKIRFE